MEDQDASIAAFSSAALFGLMSLIFLLAMPHRFSMGFNDHGITVLDWPANSPDLNPMVIEPGFGTFGSVGRCQVLLENEVSIPIKLVCGRKHEVLQNLLVDGCVDPGLNEAQWTNTSR